MAQIRTLSLDLETYSSENLTKCGVYRYAEAPDFEVLLFGYSADGAPVKVVDLTAGETLPADVRSALTDPAVTKWAFNAQFERVCLSRYLGFSFASHSAKWRKRCGRQAPSPSRTKTPNTQCALGSFASDSSARSSRPQESS